MIVVDVLTGVLLLAALFFFVAGTVGLLRFPDLYLAPSRADEG